MKLSRSYVVKLLVLLFLVMTLFAALEPLLSLHSVHVDERQYINRSMQNLEYLEGKLSAADVWIGGGSHPFTGELIIGLALALQGQAFPAPYGGRVWTANLTESQLVAARRPALLVGLVGLAGIVFLALEFNPLIAFAAALFLLSSPGFVDFSLYTMHDIYLASFTALAMVSLYFFFVKGNRRALWLSAILLGLALGSKESWDPIVGMAVLATAVFWSESRVKGAFGTFAKCLGLAFAAFAATSPVVLANLSEFLNSHVTETAPKFSLTHIFTDQSLVNMGYYSVFGAQFPSNLMIFAAATIGVVILATIQKTNRVFTGDKMLCYAMLIGLFASLDLVLTSAAFEYARNFGRHTMFEALMLVVFLGLLLKSNRRVGFAGTLLAIVTTLYSLINYTEIFALQYQETGSALAPISTVANNWPYAPIIGWTTLCSVVLMIFASGYWLVATRTFGSASSILLSQAS